MIRFPGHVDGSAIFAEKLRKLEGNAQIQFAFRQVGHDAACSARVTLR